MLNVTSWAKRAPVTLTPKLLTYCRNDIKIQGANSTCSSSHATPVSIPDTLLEDALKAAQTFVDVCNQYAPYLAGRGEISAAIQSIHNIEKGMYVCLYVTIKHTQYSV